MLIKALALILYIFSYYFSSFLGLFVKLLYNCTRNNCTRNTAGTVGIEACGDPSNGVTTSYGVVASYGSVKQEAQSSKLV